MKGLELEHQLANVDDVRLSYAVIGQGPPLLMVHGLWSSFDLWPPALVLELAKRFQVVLFDPRGIGHSTLSEMSLSYELMADDAAELVTMLGFEKVSVMGWSMGANVGIEMALRHPGLVDRLVVYSGRSGGPEDIVGARTISYVRSTPRIDGTVLTRLMFPVSWNETHPDIEEFMPRARVKLNRKAMEAQMEAVMAWKGCRDRLPQMRCRMLIVNGIYDEDTPLHRAFAMAERIEGAWLMSFPGGHGLMYQFPERLARAVMAFLEDR